MAVSGMAKSVFSVATRNGPCTDIPTPWNKHHPWIRINVEHEHTHVLIYINYTYKCSYVEIITNNLINPTQDSSARNNSQPLAIFQPISAFGQPKSILVSQISSVGQQTVTYKISYFQKTADQLLILISSTEILVKISVRLEKVRLYIMHRIKW